MKASTGHMEHTTTEVDISKSIVVTYRRFTALHVDVLQRSTLEKGIRRNSYDGFRNIDVLDTIPAIERICPYAIHDVAYTIPLNTRWNTASFDILHTDNGRC